MNKRAKIVLICVIAAIAVIAAAAVFIGAGELSRAWNTKAGGVDLSNVPDGVYTASEDYIGFTCYAEVTVRGHRIQDVKLYEERDSEWVEKAAAVAQKVVEFQSPDVDAVSGATVTSRAMLRAVEKALKSGTGR